jgi:hypothetical protein
MPILQRQRGVAVTNFVSLIVTDWGQSETPAEFDKRYHAARKRKDGGIDKRFASGRQVLREEDALLSQLTKEHMEKWDEV